MERIQIVVDGLSEEQVRKDIERNTRGWKLILQEPKGADYWFFNPFFGHSWDGTAESLRKIIITYGNVGGHQKHMILRFLWNGQDRFAWCSWEKVLYDCESDIKYTMEPKYADSMVEAIKELFGHV